MEIEIVSDKEMAEYDTGGGYHIITATIHIDASRSYRQQRESLVYEILGCLLDPLEFQCEKYNTVANRICEALAELEALRLGGGGVDEKATTTG